MRDKIAAHSCAIGLAGASNPHPDDPRISGWKAQKQDSAAKLVFIPQVDQGW